MPIADGATITVFDTAQRKATLRVSEMQSGVYYLRMSSGEDSKTVKFFKL